MRDGFGGTVHTLARLQSQLVRTVAIFSLLSLGLTFQATTPSGASNAYYSGTGYDMSYPQCSLGGKGVPDNSSRTLFAIIGLGGGRPFTTNGCATQQAQWAVTQGQPTSFYFNTGYAMAYAKSVTTQCSTLSSQQSFTGSAHDVSAQQTAWAIGCSETDTAMASAPTTSPATTPVAWWADIETGNSWSSNTSLNQATVKGIFDELHNKLTQSGSSNVQVGVYSSPSMWGQIVGAGYVNAGITADWQSGATCPLPSSTGEVNGFSLTGTNTSAPLWLAQSGSYSAYYTTFDEDVAC